MNTRQDQYLGKRICIGCRVLSRNAQSVRLTELSSLLWYTALLITGGSGTLGLLASGQICNTSPGLAGAVGSSYEDYSVTKHRRKNSQKHSGKASRDQVLRNYRWEAGQHLSLIRRVLNGKHMLFLFFGYLMNRYPPPHGSVSTLWITNYCRRV